MSRNLALFAAALLTVAAIVLEPTTAAVSDDTSAKPASGKTLDAPAEKAALAFAAKHHPELATLIRQLRRMNPDAYQKAIQELSHTSERLSRLEERAPDRYAAELALWKLDSRIRLLAAQSAMSDEDDRREQIRELLLERADVRLQQLESERARVAARLKRLDRSIEELQTHRPELVEKELNSLLKSARSRAAQKRSTAKRKRSSEAATSRESGRSRKPADNDKAGPRGATGKAARKQQGGTPESR